MGKKIKGPGGGKEIKGRATIYTPGKTPNFILKSNFDPNINFDIRLDHVLIRISKKERHLYFILLHMDSKFAIRFLHFSFLKFDLVWPFDPRYVAVASQLLTRANF